MLKIFYKYRYFLFILIILFGLIFISERKYHWFSYVGFNYLGLDYKKQEIVVIKDDGKNNCTFDDKRECLDMEVFIDLAKSKDVLLCEKMILAHNKDRCFFNMVKYWSGDKALCDKIGGQTIKSECLK